MSRVHLGEVTLQGHLSPDCAWPAQSSVSLCAQTWPTGTAAQTQTKNKAHAHLVHGSTLFPTRKKLQSHAMLPYYCIFSKVLAEAFVTEVFHTAAQPPVMASVAMVFNIKMNKATLNTIRLYHSAWNQIPAEFYIVGGKKPQTTSLFFMLTLLYLVKAVMTIKQTI